MEQEKLDLKKGDVFAGYRIIEKLGPGVMGVVYLARDTNAVRRVALKILEPELTSDENYVKLFEKQSKAAVEVKHNNIAQFYAWGKERDRLYTASEFIPGKTLASLIEGQGRVDSQITLSLLITIGKALRHLHSHGIVHGGVNPGNIRMTPLGEVKLVDAGLAKKLLLRPEKSKVKAGVTPVYLAPELVSGPTKADERSDIYSLGITAYEAVTGSKPFLSSSPHEMVLRIMNEPLLPQAMKGVHPDVSELISRMVAKAPAERPQDMLATVAEMEKLAEKLMPVVVGATPTEVTREAMAKRKTRSRREILLYVIIAVILAGAFLAFYLPKKQAGQPRDNQSLTSEEQASKALKEVVALENMQGARLKELIERYQGIARAYPNTKAAAQAIKGEMRLALKLTLEKAQDLITNDKWYEATLLYEAFEKHYEGSTESSKVLHMKTDLIARTETRFNEDTLKAARLAQKGDFQPAIEILEKAETFASPQQWERAMSEIDRIKRLAGIIQLQGPYAAAWKAAEPMIAIITDQVSLFQYETALDSCEVFLSSPLPEGVGQIIKWEKEDIAHLIKVSENFHAALGDAEIRGDKTSFTLADGTIVSGVIIRKDKSYYLSFSENSEWRIRPADISPSNVLKLAGMEVEQTDALLVSSLYRLYYGSIQKVKSQLSKISSKLDKDTLIRYQNKIELVAALPSRSISRARALLNPREIRQAVKIVESARKHIKKKNWNQAYPLLKQASKLNPIDEETWTLLAKSAAGKNLTSEAIQYFRKALALNPNNLILWNELGKLYLVQEEFGLALAVFKQASRINPRDPVAAQGYIKALQLLGQKEKARKVKEEWEKIRQD